MHTPGEAGHPEADLFFIYFSRGGGGSKCSKLKLASTLWEHFRYHFAPFFLGVLLTKSPSYWTLLWILSFHFFEKAEKQIPDGKAPCWDLTTTDPPQNHRHF